MWSAAGCYSRPTSCCGLPEVRCPYCGGLDSVIKIIRPVQGGYAEQRRRLCSGCNEKYTTYERVERVSLAVVKRDGQRVMFNKAKVISSVERAAAGFPMPHGLENHLADDVEYDLRALGKDAVDSAQIAELVIKRLREVVPVVALRYAGAHFTWDIQGYIAALIEWGGENQEGS